MYTYIALLRGINVSGQKKIKMVDLKVLLENAHFSEVTTYIQSGNIVFKSAQKDVLKLARLMEEVIEKEYQFHVPVVIIKPEEIISAKENNTFLKDESKDTKKLAFTFLYDLPTTENKEKLLSYDFPGEEMIIRDKMIYLYSEIGAGRSKMNNNFIENKLKVTASSRNLNTVLKLIEISTS